MRPDVTADVSSLRHSEHVLYRQASQYDVQSSTRLDFAMPRSHFRPSNRMNTIMSKSVGKLIMECLLVLLAAAYFAYVTRHIIILRDEAQQLKAMIPDNWTTIFPETVHGSQTEPFFQTSTVTTTVTVSSCAPTSTQSERHWFAHTVTVSGSTESSTPKARPMQAHDHADGDDAVDHTSDEGNYEWEDGDESGSKMRVPAIRIPVTWPFHDRIEHAKASARRGWKRVWHVVEIIINWPLPVEPTEDL